MRYKLAVFCRKLADFLDPHVKPSPEPITLTVKCDTDEAVRQIDSLIEAWKRIPGITMSEGRG